MEAVLSSDSKSTNSVLSEHLQTPDTCVVLKSYNAFSAEYNFFSDREITPGKNEHQPTLSYRVDFIFHAHVERHRGAYPV